jgi:hypothetical protein
MLSLRDKIHSTAEALLKSALLGKEDSIAASCGLPARTSAASTKFLGNTLGGPKSVFSGFFDKTGFLPYSATSELLQLLAPSLNASTEGE